MKLNVVTCNRNPKNMKHKFIPNPIELRLYYKVAYLIGIAWPPHIFSEIRMREVSKYDQYGDRGSSSLNMTN